MFGFLGRQPGAAEPGSDFLVGEAKAPVFVLLAQVFLVMGQEIDHHKLAPGSEHPGRLADGGGRLVEEVKNLMNGYGVEDGGRVRQLVQIGLTDLAVSAIHPFQVGARDGQHFAGQVNALGAPGAGGQQFKHTPGAGADIEQVFNAVPGQQAGYDFFDLGVVDMKGAQLVPAFGVVAEIGRRRLGAFAFDLAQALMVPGQDVIMDSFVRQQRIQVLGDLGPRTAFGQAVKDPATLAVTGQQPGFGQQLQMT